MTHRKEYERWIDDAALGALDPRRERELLSHAGECDACREAYQHAHELAALVDRGIESLIAGEPSPHFATRLRARITDEQPGSRSVWLTWKPVAAGLVSAVALAVMTVLLLPKHRHFGNDVVLSNPNTTSAARIQAPVAAQSPTTNRVQVRRGYPPAPEATRRTKPSRVQFASRFGGHDKRAARLSWASHGQGESPRAFQRRNSSTEPQVLVPAGQLEAVMQLAADIRSGRINGKQLAAEQAEAQKDMQKPIDIPRIEIKPIEIAPLPTKPLEAPSDSTAP
ncbi:MAG TPA: hypothetical protein VMF66_15090 [Candidatus Acidoferrum sp.]|nr:hypothetical protein [Candidatus Acidoferrum sp.]